jgi:hypothetical protein
MCLALVTILKIPHGSRTPIFFALRSLAFCASPVLPGDICCFFCSCDEPSSALNASWWSSYDFWFLAVLYWAHDLFFAFNSQSLVKQNA